MEPLHSNFRAPLVPALGFSASEHGEHDLLDVFLTLPPGQRDERFLDTLEAARRVGMSRRTIQLWVEFGWVRAVRIGGRYQVCFESLREHLKGC